MQFPSWGLLFPNLSLWLRWGSLLSDPWPAGSSKVVISMPQGFGMPSFVFISTVSEMSGISTHIQNLIRGIMIIKENWEQGKVRFHTSRRLSMCPDRGMGVCLVFASADLVQSMWWICFFLLYSMLKSVSTQASSFIINIVNISKLDQLYVLWITMAKSFIFFIPHSPKMAFAAVGIKSIVCVCLCIYL